MVIFISLLLMAIMLVWTGNRSAKISQEKSLVVIPITYIMVSVLLFVLRTAIISGDLSVLFELVVHAGSMVIYWLITVLMLFIHLTKESNKLLWREVGLSSLVLIVPFFCVYIIAGINLSH